VRLSGELYYVVQQWREVERNGEKWREVERSGEKWREVERSGDMKLLNVVQQERL
jgi:hypothetical protein